MANILLHIGFVRSGSSYLREYFKNHPEFYFQPQNIAGGFYDPLVMASYAEAHDAPQFYALSCESFSCWQGDWNVYGLRGHKPYDYHKFVVTICEMLHDLYPQAKMLIICRGYKTIFHSLYAHYVSLGGTLDCASIMSNHCKIFSEMLDYNFVISTYREKYGNQNVLALPYELLMDSPKRFTELIEEYAGVKNQFRFHSEKINARYSPKVLSAYLFCSRLVYIFLKPFSKKIQDISFQFYMGKLRDKRPLTIMKQLAKVMSNPDLSAAVKMGEGMKGKAEILRDQVLFEPYFEDYYLSK